MYSQEALGNVVERITELRMLRETRYSTNRAEQFLVDAEIDGLRYARGLLIKVIEASSDKRFNYSTGLAY